MVINITAIVFSVAGFILTPTLIKKSTNGSEKLSAAKALAKKPARVIPTWIVDKKREGSSIKYKILLAFLLPSFFIDSSLFSLADIIAISAHAKTAFANIKTNSSKICPPIETSDKLNQPPNN